MKPNIGYEITSTKHSDGSEYIVIEYSEDYPWHHDFKEFVMINVEEMEERGSVEWAIYCEGPGGEETRLVLIQGNPGGNIEVGIREMAVREWQSAQDWYNEHREPADA